MRNFWIIYVLVILSIATWNSTEIYNIASVWFNSDEFYRPIYTARFDATGNGEVLKIKLDTRYNVTHGFFINVPSDPVGFGLLDNLNGNIMYTLTNEHAVLFTQTISPPQRPGGVWKNGKKYALLFKFDLPDTKANGDTYLEVKVQSPITKLEKYNGQIECEVYPAYWPK